jgi:nucleoid-associated protein YgaU
MGLFDFARNAGHKLGIGKGSASTQAKEAAEKAAIAAKEHAVAVAAAKASAAKAKAITDAAQKAAADKAAAEAAVKAATAKKAFDAAVAEAKAESTKSAELENYVTKLGLGVKNLDINFNDGCAYVHGDCATEADREKVILAVGNVSEVGRVFDTVNVVAPAEQSVMHVVVSGDTLSKIAKKAYGDASKYPVIFEANKPMLKDPDEIFPGQVLRIPAL